MECSGAWVRLSRADILSSDTELEAALEHAETCSVCRIYLEQDRRMAELIRQAVPRVRAPRELRERLCAAMALERSWPGGTAPRARNRRRRASIIAAGIATLILLGFFGYRLANRPADVSAATAFADDYLRRLVEQEEFRSENRSEIASFFARELGWTALPPEIPGFQVQGAAVCLMNGRRGGAVEYRSRSRLLTYYVLPGAPAVDERAWVAVPQTDASVPPVPAIAEEVGLAIAMWFDARHQHALVGDWSSRDLQRLAALFMGATEDP